MPNALTIESGYLRQPLPPCDSCGAGLLGIYGPTLRENPGVIARLLKETRVYEPGGTVIRENEVPDEICSIRSGWAFGFNELTGGRRQIHSFLVPGDVFSVQSLLVPGWSSSNTVMALTRLTLCVFDLKKIRTAAEHASAEQIATIQDFARRAHDALCDRIVDLALRSPRQRVCRLIVELDTRLEARRLSNGTTFHLPATNAHIADHLGLAQSDVCGVLAGLRNEGLFEVDAGQATIHDREMLHAIADGY